MDMAEEVSARVGDVEAAVVVAGAPEPNIDTRLLEPRDRSAYECSAYEWERGGRGLKARQRGGGAVLGAE